MISSGSCHGPGCTRPADGDFCDEDCATSWHARLAEPLPAPAATIEIRWLHPRLGRIVEHVCETHDKVVLQALKALGIGCSGGYAEASECLFDRWRREP